MADCWYCKKRHELNSLRAKVARLESGREFDSLSAELDKEKKRRVEAEEQLRVMKSELTKYKYEAEHAKKKLERTEHTVSFLKKQVSQKTKEIKELEERCEKLTQPFLEAIEEMQVNKDSRDTEKKVTTADTVEITDKKALMAQIKDLQLQLSAKTAQLSNNNTNCSLPSSVCIGRTKIFNNRIPSGKKPGAQPGHPGHGRNRLKPDLIVRLRVPDEVIKNSSDYYKTKEIKVKQVQSVQLTVNVIQYEAAVYRRRSNGKRVWARFPSGVVNDINYDSSVKTLACILHSYGNMSYEKVQEVISELTFGKLRPSIGFLAGLEREFSDKSVPDRMHIEERMMRFPYMHADGTTVYVNGKQRAMLICTSPAGTLYYYSDHKGHKAVRRSVLRDYKGIVISDGESTFFNYGSDHQGCLEHELRYLKGSIETETDLSWAKQMRSLLQKSIHISKTAIAGGKTCLDECLIHEIEKEYDKIISIAEKEYKANSERIKYYNKGYNTMIRLKEKKQYYLLFLHDLSIPPTNSRAEQKARPAKMHIKQSGGYRDDYGNSVQFYGDTLSLIECTSDRGGSVYKMIKSVFDRPMPDQRASKAAIKLSHLERNNDNTQ